MYRSTLPSFKTKNSDSEHALRVCLTQKKESLAKQRLNQISNHINCTKFNSIHAPQVHLTQNQLATAQPFDTLNLDTPNYTLSDHDFASRVRFPQKKINTRWA